MAPSTLRLISCISTSTSSSATTNHLCTISPFSPKPPISNQNLSLKPPNHQRPLLETTFSRRHLSLLSFLALVPSLSHPDPAAAFSIGISGPKDWLKEQKRKAAKFLLAPIDASRESLRYAFRLLTGDSDYTNKDMEEVQGLLRSAARDCVLEERNSFVEFQANTGVEVCTFTLIVKNASSLLDNKDPVKLEAEAVLNDLIRTFTSLTNLANEPDVQLAPNRQKVADALMDTITSLDKFEKGIMDCLEA